MTTLNPVLAATTDRLIARSRDTRSRYLERIREAGDRGPARGRLACANLAHGFAAADPQAKRTLRANVKPNVAIVSAYNDMLSAHKPFESYPALLKKSVIEAGGIAQFAGGVPAMCDGITQGRDGMQLSLFSRDVIAMSTAIALSHDMFDAALMLGVCDKIVPGMLIGALSFGHLPTIFVPAGPMTSGLPNTEKAKVRQLYAEGKIGREELLDAEAQSYHGDGTCTFFGTANSNQLLMEAMGLHLPGSSFVNPGTPLRDALTGEAAGRRVTALTAIGENYTPIGELVDEKAIVNGCVALLATGGSTNHTMHLVAIARAAGIALTWDDISDLSGDRSAAGADLPERQGGREPLPRRGWARLRRRRTARRRTDARGRLHRRRAGAAPIHRGAQARRRRACMWQQGSGASLDESVLRGVAEPFAPEGGLKVLAGNTRFVGDQDVRGRDRTPDRHCARASCSTIRPSSWPRSVTGNSTPT